MRIPVAWVVLVCAQLLIPLGSAQPTTKATPKFDVVSIRALLPELRLVDPDVATVLPGGQYVNPVTGLWSLISFAYEVKDPSIRLLGLPKWAMSQDFAIAAKASPDFPALSVAENREQVRLMVRSMLEDRFRLKLHTESRTGTIFELEVGKGGLRVPEVAAPVPPEKEGRVNMALGDTRGRMIATKATMAGIGPALTVFLKEPVVDKTGLTGYYDFDLRWTAPPVPGAPPSSGLGAEGIGMLISNLRDQLGLSLKKTTGSVKYWEVDSVEMPTPN